MNEKKRLEKIIKRYKKMIKKIEIKMVKNDVNYK